LRQALTDSPSNTVDYSDAGTEASGAPPSTVSEASTAMETTEARRKVSRVRVRVRVPTSTPTQHLIAYTHAHLHVATALLGRAEGAQRGSPWQSWGCCKSRELMFKEPADAGIQNEDGSASRRLSTDPVPRCQQAGGARRPPCTRYQHRPSRKVVQRQVGKDGNHDRQEELKAVFPHVVLKVLDVGPNLLLPKQLGQPAH